MALKRKLTRKQFLNQQDEFITLSAKISEFIRNQGRLLVIALGIFLGGGLLAGILYLYQGHKEEQAGLLEEVAYRAYHGQVKGETASNSTKGPVFASRKERYQTARAKYQELLAKYPNTPSARRAQFYLGTCAYYLGEYEQAQWIYRQLLEESSPGDIWYREALRSLGYAQEGAGEYLGAADTYQQVVDLSPGKSKLAPYLDLARAYEQAKSWQQTIQTYETMLKLTDEPEQQELLKTKLRQVRASAGSSQTQE